MSIATSTLEHEKSYSPQLIWIAFFALVGVGWVGLIARAVTHSTNNKVGMQEVFGMWTLMTMVMMATTAVPVLASLRHILRTGSIGVWWMFLSTYLMMWMGFALLATLLQTTLTQFGWMEHHRSSMWLTGSLLIIAGTYQFSSLKDSCQTQCAAPMTFFMRYWRDGVVGAMRMGARHGLTCIGCCWALMLLSMGGGMSNALFMVLGAAVMAVEKFPNIGKRISSPLGGLLLAIGVWMIAAQFIFGAQSTAHLHI